MKKFLMIILSVLCCSCVAYADENTYTDIQTTYSSDISPQEGDTFVFTYKNLGTNATDSFKLDVSKTIDKTAKLDIESGDYMLMNVEYIGHNENIDKEGYVVTSYFSIGPTIVDSIYLGIGQQAGKVIEEERNDTISMRYGLSIPSITDKEQERLSEEIPEYKSEVEKNSEDVKDLEEINKSEDQEDPSEENEDHDETDEKHQKKDNQRKKSSSMPKLILIAVIILASIISVFTLAKKYNLK